MKPLKVTTCLLLLLQAFHLASLQTSTDSPGRTIDKSWLRKPVNQALLRDNTAIPQVTVFDFGTDTMDFGGENSGIASGSMSGNTEEEENVITHEKNENQTSEDLNISKKMMSSATENGTTENPKVAVRPANATTDSTNSTQPNTREGEEGFNSTRTTEKPTTTPDSSNKTVLQSTAVAPENQTTQQSTTTADKGLANRTGSTDKPATNTSAPETTKTSVGYSPTTVFLSKTTNTSLITTTAAPNTPERANKTGGGIFSERDNLGESGMDSDPYRRKRNVAWVAILGTAAAAACVGVVAYLVLKKKHQKGFTHRKLVEEFPSDPVLRLDNCEPLDLKFGGSGSAYYNPGLQGDNIQMADIPGRR